MSGSAYFRSQTFFDNPLGINDLLKTKFYAFPALPPASHHDDGRIFDAKIITLSHELKKRKITLAWEFEQPDLIRYYVIYKSDDISNSENIIAITANNSITLKRKMLGTEPSMLRITAVDRYRIESQAIKFVAD